MLSQSVRLSRSDIVSKRLDDMVKILPAPPSSFDRTTRRCEDPTAPCRRYIGDTLAYPSLDSFEVSTILDVFCPYTRNIKSAPMVYGVPTTTGVTMDALSAALTHPSARPASTTC